MPSPRTPGRDIAIAPAVGSREQSAPESEKGQAALEFLVVLPVLALFMFGIIEMGAAWRTHHVVAHTAREGARLTILPGAVENEVRAEMADRLTQGGLNPANGTITIQTGIVMSVE